GDDFALARYTKTGALDLTFDGDGKVLTDFAGHGDVGDAVTVLADGRIVAAGYANNGSSSDLELAAYNPNGSLAVFSAMPGRAIAGSFAMADNPGQAVLVQSDGKIVVGGFEDGGTSGNDFALTRLTAAGPIDTGFGTDGT